MSTTSGMKALSSSDSLNSMSEENKISRREEVRLLREMRLREKEGNLTFKPTLTKSVSNISLASEQQPSVSIASTPFDRLYGEAKKRKEAERNVDTNCTFKPTITTKGKKRASTPEGTSNRLYDAPGAGKPRSSSVDKSKDKRSFSPQITSRGRSIERSGSLSSPATRLYSQAQTLKENREALASKLNEQDSKECTFAPKTNKDAKAPASKDAVPVQERMEKYLAAREKRMADLKEKQQAEAAQQATFKPVSFTKGRSPSAERKQRVVGAAPVTAKQRTADGAGSSAGSEGNSPPPGSTGKEPAGATVFDRLASASASKKPVVFEDKEEKELTFKPNLVSKRAPSPSRQEEASKYGNVHNRLYQKGTEKRAESEVKKNQLRKQLDADNTFSPAVPLNHRSHPDSPTKDAVFERLSASRQHVHEIFSQVKTEFELDNCTFRPEINKNSDDVASKKITEPAYLRLSAEAKRLREENAKRQAKKQEEELENCTFAPVIDKKSSSVVSSKRAGTKESVFQRLSVGSPQASLSPPPAQAHVPITIPRVARKSTAEKLAESTGVVRESGSPSRETRANVVQEKMAEHTQELEQLAGQQQEEDQVASKLVPISPVHFSATDPVNLSEEFFQDEEGSEF